MSEKEFVRRLYELLEIDVSWPMFWFGYQVRKYKQVYE